jgi:hypothetical protein
MFVLDAFGSYCDDEKKDDDEDDEDEEYVHNVRQTNLDGS